MPLPRLTEIGDTFTGTPRAITFEGEEKQTIRILFEGFEDYDALLAPRITMDARFMDLGFYDPPAPNARASEIDGVVRYDEAIGVPLVFSVVQGNRGRKGWSVKKYLKPATATTKDSIALGPGAVSTVPPAARLAPKAPEAKPEPAAPPPKSVVTNADGKFARSPEKSPEAKREEIRAAYSRELAFVIAGPAKVAKKAKVDFDVNAAVSTILIEMAKRGCL